MKKFLSLMLALTMCLSLTIPAFAAGAGGTAAAQSLLSSMAYYGDVSRCKMSAEQARAYAEQIRRFDRKQREITKTWDRADYYRDQYGFASFAALFDAGSGNPYLLFACGIGYYEENDFTFLNRDNAPFDGWDDMDAGAKIGIYEYKSKTINEALDNYVRSYEVYSDHINIYFMGSRQLCSVYPFQNGEIGKACAAHNVPTYDDEGIYSDDEYYIGENSVDRTAFWNMAESGDFYCRAVYDTRQSGTIEGCQEADTLASLLDAYAAALDSKPAVQLSSQKLTVNGEAKNTEIYNIDGSNYFKLRDMAALLNGTGSQFSVDWDAASSTIAIKTGAAYTPVGGELTTGEDKSASAVVSAQKVTIDGKAVELVAYNIGGNNFFKLRDLGTALNFDVDWDEATGTMLVRSR